MTKFTNQFLLITDLDNTLVGDDLATKELNQYLSTNRQHYVLVYATGRSYNSAQHLMQERELIEPDYWVTGVGTEIYARGYLDLTWAIKISTDWNSGEIASLIDEQFPSLKPQNKAEQNPWKLSFHLDSLDRSISRLQEVCETNTKYSELENTPFPKYTSQFVMLKERKSCTNATLEKLDASLKRKGLNAQIVFSSNVDVDILPINANKGNAVQYLQEKTEIAPYRTLVCGDSGNDISMFRQDTFGVIVNNAQTELVEWYRAYSDRRHYLANNSYAGGILEAMQKFNLLFK
ncbi:HAD-IIB family hydrolase [Tumidithrix elongata RA019]|uniref:HAD-IIB family hydrolase n=1 Tax=Tumidithrix elongata BACA0141 TaxID=2716417 RepID=A0AAW9Q176_9CYAN|nr:HAD-IIB family hydrolase [Tumidithrix elongata RA019]